MPRRSRAATRPLGRRTRSIIPEALTPLVGRDAELRELMQLLADHRFVTLVGPGGVGKTRLALEAARAESADLRFGGCLVELAPVGDPAGVRAAIASALELPDPSRLAELIGDQRDAHRARQLRARDHDRGRGRGGPVASLPGPAHPRHEPRGAASRWRDRSGRCRRSRPTTPCVSSSRARRPPARRSNSRPSITR